MRPVLHGDIVTAARVLLPLPHPKRREIMQQMLEQASFADLHFKRLRRGHPVWGNGSLMAAAMARDMAPEPFLDDLAYCRCFVVVFEELIKWRCERVAFNRPRKLRKKQRLDQVSYVLSECPHRNLYKYRIRPHLSV